jgi:hypothetical protein
MFYDPIELSHYEDICEYNFMKAPHNFRMNWRYKGVAREFASIEARAQRSSIHIADTDRRRCCHFRTQQHQQLILAEANSVLNGGKVIVPRKS